MTRKDLDLERFENRIILALPSVAEAMTRMTKILSRGRMDSDIVSAVADLRHAANAIEQANNDYKQSLLGL